MHIIHPRAIHPHMQDAINNFAEFASDPDTVAVGYYACDKSGRVSLGWNSHPDCVLVVHLAGQKHLADQFQEEQM